MVRRARLRGADSGKHYAHAFSAIRTDLIPPVFRQRLIDREIGIGALIRDSGLESYREVMEVGVEVSPDVRSGVGPAECGTLDKDPTSDISRKANGHPAGSDGISGGVFRTYRIIIAWRARNSDQRDLSAPALPLTRQALLASPEIMQVFRGPPKRR